jgi:hypothetical protein
MSLELSDPKTIARRVTSHSRRRRWMFRLLSIVLGLSVFGLIELACVAVGWGESQFGDDPLVGFEAIRPLFEKTADGQGISYLTSATRLL